MTVSEMLLEGFGRLPALVHEVLDGMAPDELTYRVDARANSIAWLVWHLSRIEDDHIADVAVTDQVWTSHGWARRWNLPFEDSDTGYGHSSREVAAVTGDADLLGGYFDAVHDATVRFVRTFSETDLDRVVDERWDPPVTLGARLVSVLGHGFEQSAQAAFVRGIVERRRGRVRTR